MDLNKLLFWVEFTWGFWYLYILVMGLYRAHLSGRLSKSATILGLPALGIGYAVDVFANFTVACVVFADLPHEFLVTSRLKRYLAGDASWRVTVAKWICTNLLDPFDPSGKHC